MDSERYARVRELFLAVEELPREQQRPFLEAQAGSDQKLIAEVLSLLEEHDEDLARLEGDSAKKPALPAHDPEDSDTKRSSPASSASVGSPFLPGGGREGDSDTPPKSHSPMKRKPKRRSQSDRPSTQRQAEAGEVTQHGSQRTHATPRYPNDRPKRTRPPSAGMWQHRAKRHRRFNSGWLWLAAILPTVLIGGWTYREVTLRLRATVAQELTGVADGVSNNVNRFLSDQAKLVQSWGHQPDLRAAVVELTKLAASDASPDELKQSTFAGEIKSQLQALSGRDDIKYVVWDRTGTIIASWLPDGADVGGSVSPDGAGNLARAMRGQTVLFGPEILKEDGSGFKPETDLPVMAEIVPIRNDRERVVGTLLVRGFGMFDDFDEIFRNASVNGLDVYAVNEDGVMVTNSVVALESLGEATDAPALACQLRVSDPGDAEDLSLSGRGRQPLTYAVAGVAARRSDSRMESYQNYVGEKVVGAWRWMDPWGVGIVVERTSESAYATASVVQYGFLLLVIVLTITALTAASQIARRTALAQASVHPLSRYQIVSELGSGGMGVVYRAEHTQLGRDTALKVLRGDRDNQEDRLRFDREAKLAASLGSPHTVTIYDYGRSDEDEAYCVMEFLQGITLYDVVARSGFQEYGRAVFVLRQICDSLGEAHQLGLVHRDVKPQNVMLSLDASVGDWAVVFDFGLAKPLNPEADAYQTAETIWAGTPMYMAPERYREPNKIDPRSDIYSVGCIAYFLLAGRPPFIECDPESLFALVLAEQPISIRVHRDKEVPDDIDNLVRRCMAKSMQDRYQTIEELAQDLDALIKKYPWSAEDARSWWRIHGEEVEQS